MRVTTFIFILCIAVSLLLPTSGWGMIASNASGISVLDTESEGLYLFFGASVVTESGDMTYIIEGPEDGGWKSELEWPLDTITYVGGIVSLSFFEKLQANAGIWKAVTDDAGDMKDSDWLYGFFGDVRAVYSESEGTVDATQFDVNLRYNFLKRENLVIGGILGYSQTKWEWEAGNGFQTTIAPQFFYQGPIEGLGITYEEEVKVPYLGLAFSLFPENSSFGLNIYSLYSPKAVCKDEDDHVLRSKLSTGDTEGTFFSLGSDIRWQFSKSWSLTGSINYSSYDLEGEQEQEFYADDPADPTDPPAGTRFTGIDLTVEGSQVYLGLMVGYEL